MKEELDQEKAKNLMETVGYEVATMKKIPEGNQHHIFECVLSDGKIVIARFDKALGISGGKRIDPIFHSELSLEREAAAYSLVKNKTSLPAPKVYDAHNVNGIKFLIVEKMPGVTWNEYLKRKNYSCKAFLNSIFYLGKDLAKFHKIKFSSFGDVMNENSVSPEGIEDFTDRLKQLILLKLQRAKTVNCFSESEFSFIRDYFRTQLEKLPRLVLPDYAPVLNIFDIHPNNFLVDENGKPSGYFDIEFPQSGIPALDISRIHLEMFGYFDRETFDKSKKWFFRGYKEEGGSYDEDNRVNKRLELVISLGHILSATSAYYRVKDGLRDDWSEKLKKLLFSCIEAEQIDYEGYMEIFRRKTKQPRKPSIP